MDRAQAPQPDLVVDTTGKFCPVPIVEIAKAMKGMKEGAVVELVATDPGAEPDVQAWCKATRNLLLGLWREGRTIRALVKKGQGQAQGQEVR